VTPMGYPGFADKGLLDVMYGWPVFAVVD
jgi:hypothetical protein